MHILNFIITNFMNRKYQQPYYTQKQSPIYSSALSTNTYHHYSSNPNSSTQPYNKPIFDKRPQPTSFHNNNKFQDGIINKTPSSRIAELNDRVLRDTNLFKIRSGYKRNHTIRSRSTQLKRSRMSADQKSSYNQYYKPPYNPYQNDTHSMSNSRTSNQFLCQPIISHNNMAPHTRQMYEQLPSFKKINSKQFGQFNIAKPVLQNEYIGHNTQKSMFGQKEYKSPLIFQSQHPIKTMVKQQSSENFDQFLDMDFYSKKPPIEQMRSSTQLRDFEQNQPISPVTPMHKQNSQKTDPIYFESSETKYTETIPKPTFGSEVRRMLEKVDRQGKLITIFLVGLGIILVIYQAIR